MTVKEDAWLNIDEAKHEMITYNKDIVTVKQHDNYLYGFADSDKSYRMKVRIFDGTEHPLARTNMVLSHKEMYLNRKVNK